MKDKTPTLLDIFEPEFVKKFMEIRIYGNDIEDNYRAFAFVLSSEESVLMYYKRKKDCYLPDESPARVPDIEAFRTVIQEYFGTIFPLFYDARAEDFEGLGTDETWSAKEMVFDIKKGFVDLLSKQRAYQADASFMLSDHLMMFDRYGRPFFSEGVIPQRTHEGCTSRDTLTSDDLEFLSSHQDGCEASNGHIGNKVITPIGYRYAFLVPKPKEQENNYQP